MQHVHRRHVGLPARSGRITRHGIGAEKTRRRRMIKVLVPGVGRRRCVIQRMHRVIVLLSEHGQRQQEHAEGDGYGPRSLTWRRHRRSLSRALSRGTVDWAARRRAAPGKIDWDQAISVARTRCSRRRPKRSIGTREGWSGRHFPSAAGTSALRIAGGPAANAARMWSAPFSRRETSGAVACS